ncbi:MAG: DUF5681 domain-containing protein [Xanthobacteraceae bacterium]
MDDIHPGTDVERPRGRPFEPGVSGNPSGRPKGVRNRTTMAVEALLDGEAEALTRKVVETALKGDAAALRFCVARLLSPRRDRPVEFDLPEIACAGDAVKVARAILATCAQGTLSPRQAADVMGLLSKIHTPEVGDFEARPTELERQLQA